MDIMLTGEIPQPMPPGQMNKPADVSEAAKKQFAKDFESVFVSKLLDEMKNTVTDWGGEKDGACEQVEGIFWLHLARDIADKGGFGMWKDIYKFLNDSEQKNKMPELLDNNL